MRRVVITGMGALTPIGNNLEEYWSIHKGRKSFEETKPIAQIIEPLEH